MHPDSARQVAAAGIMNSCPVLEQVPDTDLRKHIVTCHARNRDSIRQTEPDAYVDLLRVNCKFTADYRINRAFFDQLPLAGGSSVSRTGKTSATSGRPGSNPQGVERSSEARPCCKRRKTAAAFRTSLIAG